jgi:hypothetical protein
LHFTIGAGRAVGRGTNRPFLKRAAGAAALSAALLALPGSASAAVAPDHLITSFPKRDFVSAEGYNPDHLYTLEVQHPGSATPVGTVTDVQPDGAGILEVNHPGGACWVGVTPDIRAGDVVRIIDQTATAAANAAGVAAPAPDESTVRNVTALRPVQTAPDTVQIHGTAQDALGNPLPIGELEQRLVAPGEQFLINGKRQISATSAAGSEGTLSYDAAGSINWTATYKLLPADVDRALGAESRGIWLDPAVPSTETTIYENGAAAVAGPSAPCTAPLEKLPPPPGSETIPPSTPTGLSASFLNGSVSLNWQPSSDNVGVVDYGVYRTDNATGLTTAIATVQNPDGAAPAPTSFVDKNVIPGSYTYTVDAGDAVGNRSAQSAGAATVATARVTAGAATNDPPVPPHGLIAFPSRDFISADGYTPGTAYTFQVVRNGQIISTSTPVVADATGLAEVNHPGGGCWEGVTPNIQPGDQVRIVAPDGTSDATTVAGVTAERPIVTSVDPITGGGTVEVHGSAQDATGAPLAIDQIEQRLVAPGDAFDLNGRRTIRADSVGIDGTLTYDAPGSTNWTAKYTLQTPDDLARAVGGKSTSGTAFDGAESRILWLGRNALAGNELTIYENGPAVTGGPSAGIAGCTSGPAEIPAANALLSAAPKFADTAVGSQTAAQDITLTNGGDAPLHVRRAYLAGLNPGDFAITANTADGATVAPGASVKVSVAFKPTAAGLRQANLSFADDAANTTDQTVKLTASTPPAAGGKATAPIQSLAAGQQITSAANKPASTIEVGLRWTATGTRSELQMATGNTVATLGAFGAPPVGTQLPAGATSTTVALKMGSVTGTAYQFRVRSCTATTCGAWTTGPAFTLQPADENGFAAAAWKGNWTTDSTVLGAYGGTVRWAAGSAAATIVDRIQFTVSGNAAWVSTLGPDRGLAQVQIDGGKPDVVDLYSPTVQPARVAWARDALPPGLHTVTVTVLGKRSDLNPAPCNTGTKCARVDVDGSVVIK